MFYIRDTVMLTKVKHINARLYPQKLYYGPEWLVLGVNNICNLHCKMCDVGTKTNQTNFAVNLVGSKPVNMPEELIRRIIDQAAQYYPKTKLGYAFTEPLIYPHLIESLEYANKKGLYTSITTNALNLKLKYKELVEAGLNELNISLDGPQDVHNDIRGHNSSFQRAIEGMNLIFGENKRPDVSVFCVITEWNVGFLEKFVNSFAGFPLKRLGLMHTNYTPHDVAELHNARYGAHYHATHSNVEESDVENINLDVLIHEIKMIRQMKYSFPVSFSPELKKPDDVFDFYSYPHKLMGKRCHDAFSNIMIKSDGSVIPSHGRCYNLDLGNLYEQDLPEIWNSLPASRFRKDLNKAGGLFPACSRCCSVFG